MFIESLDEIGRIEGCSDLFRERKKGEQGWIILEDSLNLLPEDYVLYEILGGNHAQFGWYGPQKNDGTPTISTKIQQDIITDQILDFIE